MSIRRRLMMHVGKSDPYDAMGYVKKGKIFHLDGIDVGETADAWTDLIGGYVYSKNGATRLSNGWSLNGQTMQCPQYGFLSQNTNQTIEVVLKPKSSTGSQPVWMQGGNNNLINNTILFFYNQGVITFLQRNKTYAITFTANAYHCISLNLDRGLVNGVAKSPQSKTDYWNNSAAYSCIGTRSGAISYAYKGGIYSIRVYNRKLSAAEMLHNQQVDNERFNLGLNL